MSDRFLSTDTDLSALFDIELEGAPSAAPKAAEYFDRRCSKCGGTGRYTKRLPCYSCNGTGKIRGGAVRMLDFATEHPQVAQWIEANKATSNFAASMTESIATYGSLTDKQLAACERSVAHPVTEAPQVSTAKLMAAFDAAKKNGLKRPKMRFAQFEASLAPATGKNPGAVYLKAGETYLGKIDAAGRFMASREATSAQQEAIVQTMEDPLAAAVAYGRRNHGTDNEPIYHCSICGIQLTDPKSKARGIGPICAEKFGF